MAGMRLQKLFKALIKPRMFLEYLTELDDLREVRQGPFDVQLTFKFYRGLIQAIKTLTNLNTNKA